MAQKKPENGLFEEAPLVDKDLAISDQRFDLAGERPEHRMDFQAQLISDIDQLRGLLKSNLKELVNNSTNDVLLGLSVILARLQRGNEGFGAKLIALICSVQQEIYRNGTVDLMVGDENYLEVQLIVEESLKRAFYLCSRVLMLLDKAVSIKSETQRGLDELRTKIETESSHASANYMTSDEHRAVERARANLEKLRAKLPSRERSLRGVQEAIDEFLSVDINAGNFGVAAWNLDGAARRLIQKLKPYATDVAALEQSVSMNDLESFLKFSVGLRRNVPAPASSSEEDGGVIDPAFDSRDVRPSGSVLSVGRFGALASAALVMAVLLFGGKKSSERGSASVQSDDLAEMAAQLHDANMYNSAIEYYAVEYGVDHDEAVEMVLEKVREIMVSEVSELRNVPVGQEYRFSLPVPEEVARSMQRLGTVRPIAMPTLATAKVLNADLGVALVDISKGPDGKEEKTYGNITHKLVLEVKVTGPNGKNITRTVEMEVPTSLIYLQSITRGGDEQ